MPGGSGVSMEFVPGFDRTNLRLTKRAAREFSKIINLRAKCLRVASKRFLKREAAKSRWLHPLDSQATVRFMFFEHYLKQPMHRAKESSVGKKAAVTRGRRLYAWRQVVRPFCQ